MSIVQAVIFAGLVNQVKVTFTFLLHFCIVLAATTFFFEKLITVKADMHIHNTFNIDLYFTYINAK